MAAPPSSSGGTSPVLKLGLAALQQKRYAEAVGHLEEACQANLIPKHRLQAKQALAIAYEKTGQSTKAIEVCQQLRQAADGELQAWCDRALQRLAKKPSKELSKKLATSSTPAPNSQDAGFVPLQNLPQPKQRQVIATDAPPSQESPSKPDGSNPAGFVPLGSGTSHPVSVSEPSSDRDPISDGDRQDSVEELEAFSGAFDLADPLDREPLQVTKPEVTPVESSEPASPEQTQPSEQPREIPWKNAPRAQKWRSLRVVKPQKLWLIQGATVVAMFWAVRLLFGGVMGSTNRILYLLHRLPLFHPIALFYRDPTALILWMFLGFAIATPWLLDLALQGFYQLQPLSPDALAARSPEAVRVLKRSCKQKGWRLPQLYLLPDQTPLAFCYGHLPNTARLVVSEGLLEQLQDEEIAAIAGAELGHITLGDMAVMSWITAIAQVPYLIFWQAAMWANKLTTRKPTASGLERWIVTSCSLAAAIALSLSYGVHRWLKVPALWLSRQRLYYSDRNATDLTGNPNALARALLKIAIGTAEQVDATKKVAPLLESFNLLLPVSPNQAIALGSYLGRQDTEALLQWDRQNPYAGWLVWNNSHPLLGDRLNILTRYALHWELEPELTPASARTSRRRRVPLPPKVPALFANLPAFPLVIQGAPYWGAAVGFGIAAVLVLLGGLGALVDLRIVAWLWRDRLWLSFGLTLLGFSLGTFWRINFFFPDMKPSELRRAGEANPIELFINAAALPADSIPVQLSGTLLGKPGWENAFGQHLWLRTRQGLVKLHDCSQLGAMGNPFAGNTRPYSFDEETDWIGREAIATGWYRRGATPWIDLDTLQMAGSRPHRSHHPIWSTVVAIATAVIGVYAIAVGGL